MLQGLARTAHRERPDLGAEYSYDPEGLYVYLIVCQVIDMNSLFVLVLGENVNAYIIDT